MFNARRAGFSFTSVLIALVLGAFLGAAGTWLVLEKERGGRPPASGSGSTPSNMPPVEREARDDYFSRKLREWNLDPDEIRSELNRAGRVLRQASRDLGSRLAEETSDVRIIAQIKAKYTLDDGLSAWNISVGCKDGHVTLTGRVESSEQIGRAIVLALDTPGVVDVDSSLRVQAGGSD